MLELLKEQSDERNQQYCTKVCPKEVFFTIQLANKKKKTTNIENPPVNSIV